MRPSVNIERSAANFVALRRQYPIEFGTYVEPIFRDLRIDSSVFGPEAKTRVAGVRQRCANPKWTGSKCKPDRRPGSMPTVFTIAK